MPDFSYIALEIHRNLDIINVLKIILRDLNRFMRTVLPNITVFCALMSKGSFADTSIAASFITALPGCDAKIPAMNTFYPSHASAAISALPAFRREWWNSESGFVRRSLGP
jgi:hypothetical protein